ncbi:MAG: ATP synthase subunit I [Clostridia bacterium]|nr:ATP synthase subunit I [Clostridia bacterium]
MKIEPTVRKETLRIAKGTCVLTVVMLLVFALLKQWNMTVLWGALLGTAVAILNFFLLGLSVQKAADMMKGVEMPPEPEEDENGEEQPAQPLPPEVNQAKQRMQLSYTGRMIMMGAAGIMGLALPCFHAVATVLPLLFPRLIIHLWNLQQNKQKEA